VLKCCLCASEEQFGTGAFLAVAVGASVELFRGEVAEALSAKIARLEAEDQQTVVTELRTHEQGLVGVAINGRPQT
jgi:hypothetical protein